MSKPDDYHVQDVKVCFNCNHRGEGVGSKCRPFNFWPDELGTCGAWEEEN